MTTLQMLQNALEGEKIAKAAYLKKKKKKPSIGYWMITIPDV